VAVKRCAAIEEVREEKVTKGISSKMQNKNIFE
jgi:hypothetical protein